MQRTLEAERSSGDGRGDDGGRLLRLQFLRGHPVRLSRTEPDMDFLLTVTDDLGAEAYFGDQPLRFAIDLQCRWPFTTGGKDDGTEWSWRTLPSDVFMLSPKTGDLELSPYLAGRGHPVEGRLDMDALLRAIKGMAVGKGSQPSHCPERIMLRLHIWAHPWRSFGWSDASPFLRITNSEAAIGNHPQSSSDHDDDDDNDSQRSTKRRKRLASKHCHGKNETNGTAAEPNRITTQEQASDCVVLPLLSSPIEIALRHRQQESNKRSGDKQLQTKKRDRATGGSSDRSASNHTTQERSRAIEREFIIEGEDTPLRIVEHYGSFLGSHLWDGALVSSFLLCHMCSSSSSSLLSFLANKEVLELGSGCGLLGLTASKLGANVTMSDLSDVLPALRRNLDLNTKRKQQRDGRVEMIELDWTDDAALRRVGQHWPPWDHIIAADVMYSDTVFQLFLRAVTTIVEVALSSENAKASNCEDGSAQISGSEGHSRRTRSHQVSVLVAHKQRCDEEQAYFAQVRKHFDVTLVGTAFSTSLFSWTPRRF